MCSFKGVQRVVQLSKRDCVVSLSPPGQIFLFPRLINQSVATKPNCNQHQNARRVRARWKGDNNNLVAQEWRRGFGRRRALIRKQRCVRRVFVALVFFNFIYARVPHKRPRRVFALRRDGSGGCMAREAAVPRASLYIVLLVIR